VEGTILSLTVKDVLDMRSNKSNTEQWTAFVKRNPLLWDTDPVYIKMQEGDTRTFTAKIVNVGGTNVSYAIENLPSWLSVNYPAGNLQPLGNKELTFTVYGGINIGNYETAIGLTCGNGVTEILPVQVKVTGVRPDWNVNPSDFFTSMNITGQVQITGVFQEDVEDLLAAFIGDTCVGVTSPTYVNSKNAYFTFANIYGNMEHSGQLLKFKFWDASTGRIYPIIETSIENIHFTPSQILGSTVNPVIFNALNFAEQIIPLKKGWSWVSYNVLNDNPSILDQMKNSLTVVGTLIKGRDVYLQQPGWYGDIDEISEKSMYLINTTADHALILAGQNADPATTPITINHEWNWIGYIPAFTLPVESAFAGLDAQAGDQIKGQTGYTTYTGSDWVGNLSFMQAGKGYMYYSTNTAPQTFNYPSTNIQKRLPENSDSLTVLQTYDLTGLRSSELPILRSSGYTPIWTVNINKFSSSMTMTAIVSDFSVEVRSEAIEVGAFSGNDCRGSAFLKYIEEFDRYICFLMIYGEGNEPITLKVFDHETATETNADNTPVNFTADLIFGNPFMPYNIVINGVNEIVEPHCNASLQVYPNPTTGILRIEMCDRRYDIFDIEIFDVYGRNVFNLKSQISNPKIDISHLPAGVYFLKIADEMVKVVKR
jgi:hypothetical protein